ncbi:MAG: Asp-tRNA(Asn)/Glu-tRNA(Gln) amidotransferase subunit GatB [Candidatus Aenigmarchaeota archaeon]|nr:Asp-tRNA(Asn)/Glu-tRNA(Gln) amidotransferase subunit GatB [Candidatus Aenigmarchaeota archaeon]
MKVMMGIEVHCQLSSKSKLFCSCSTNTKDKKPNENTCPICLGFPGSKPKVNKAVIDYGIMVAKALNCKIAEKMYFSRKSYFYPDMSKNFQITQYEIPLAVNGFLEIDGEKIRIKRIHIEEDPAKLVHKGGDITTASYVLIDYNRAGMPLLEIVTEPDFTTPKQVRLFLEKLSSILEHLGVYEAEREASLRVDANISLEGGERIEIKNITGFADVEKALNYEIVRQRGLLRMNMKVERETRHFDADRRVTKSLRKKEYEEDYGYIFDPDLAEIEISKQWIDKISEKMPELPDQRVQRFVKQYGIDEYQAKVIIYTDKNLADFFEKCCEKYKNAEKAAKWIITYLLKSLNWHSISIKQSKVSVDSFVEFLELMDNNTITERYAKELIKEYVDTGVSPKELIKGKVKSLSEKDLKDIILKVLEENQKAVQEYLQGKEKSIEFLIGQVLAKTKKQADPKIIRKILLSCIKK